jgi:hypothetical protein
LTEIEKDLPIKKHLPFDKKNLVIYYTNVQAKSIILSNCVIIKFESPIVNSERFHLFKIKTYQIKFKNTTAIATLNLKYKYFGISENRNKTLLLSENEINQCTIKIENLKVCSKYNEDNNQNPILNKCINDRFHGARSGSCTQFYSMDNLKKKHVL